MTRKLSSTRRNSISLITFVRDNERAACTKLTPEKAEILRRASGMWAGRGDINERWMNENRLTWESVWKID